MEGDVRKSNHPSNNVVRATTTKPKREKWSDEGEQLFSESYIEQVGHWEANVKKKEEKRRLRFQQRFHAATAYDPLDLEDQPVQQPPHSKRLQRLGRLPNTLEWARPRPVRFGSSRTTRRQASHIHSRIRKMASTTPYEEGDVTTAIESQSRWRENRKRLRRTRAGSDGEGDEAYLRYRLSAIKEENEREKQRESEEEDKWKEKEKEKDRSKGKEKEFDDVQTETEKERREDTDTEETEKEEEEEGFADDDENIFVGDENVRSGLLPRRFPQQVTRRQDNEEDEETEEGEEEGKPSNQIEITPNQNDSKQHSTTAQFRSTSGKRFRLKRKAGGEEALSRFSALSLTSACSSDASCSSSTANTPSFGSSSSTDEGVATTVDEEDKMNMVSPETNQEDENAQNVSHRKRKTRTSSEGNNFEEIGRLRRSKGKGKEKETVGEPTDNDDDECEDDDEAKEGKSIRLFCRRRRKSRRKLLREGKKSSGGGYEKEQFTMAKLLFRSFISRSFFNNITGRFCATDSETDEEALAHRSRRHSKSDSEEAETSNLQYHIAS
ncbi:hypothetical protein QOT17_008297 [Balamuthia mandrillaris]